MYSVEEKIPSGSRAEWRYITGKTQQFAMHLGTVRLLLAGYLDYGNAFWRRRKGDDGDFLGDLISAQTHFVEAREQSMATCRKVAEMSDDPTEWYLLFRYNVRFVVPIAEFCKFINNVVNFHCGQPYWAKINWNHIAPSITS